MKKLLFILMALFTLTLGVQAQGPARVPAYPGVIVRVQPDGDTLHVFLRGDERKHFMMTVDGWQVQEDKNGKICYCKSRTRKIDGEKKIVPVVTRRQAHDADRRKACEQRWLDRHGVKKANN